MYKLFFIANIAFSTILLSSAENLELKYSFINDQISNSKTPVLVALLMISLFPLCHSIY